MTKMFWIRTVYHFFDLKLFFNLQGERGDEFTQINEFLDFFVLFFAFISNTKRDRMFPFQVLTLQNEF